MPNALACSVPWTLSEGTASCSGVLESVPSEPVQDIAPEDAAYFSEQALILFAIVFGFLVLKKLL